MKNMKKKNKSKLDVVNNQNTEFKIGFRVQVRKRMHSTEVLKFVWN